MPRGRGRLPSVDQSALSIAVDASRRSSTNSGAVPALHVTYTRTCVPGMPATASTGLCQLITDITVRSPNRCRGRARVREWVRESEIVRDSPIEMVGEKGKAKL